MGKIAVAEEAFGGSSIKTAPTFRNYMTLKVLDVRWTSKSNSIFPRIVASGTVSALSFFPSACLGAVIRPIVDSLDQFYLIFSRLQSLLLVYHVFYSNPSSVLASKFACSRQCDYFSAASVVQPCARAAQWFFGQDQILTSLPSSDLHIATIKIPF